MRIALVGSGMIAIPPPDYGAVEKHIWNLGAALRKRGHDVFIVNEVVGPASADEYRWAFRARKLVAHIAPDIVHVHTPGVASIFSALGPRRFVYTTHSRHWATVDGLGERVGFALERAAVRRARVAIAVSPQVGAAARALNATTRVVPNGVDVDRYAPRLAARNGKRIVGVGEVREHKQWHVAASALAGLPASLTIVGPRPDPAYARRVETAAPGQVTLAGRIPEDALVALLADADMLAHPSVSESFGMAVVEGMSCGLPVVASDILASLVSDHETGLLIPNAGGDEARIPATRKAFELLLADGAARTMMGASARERAVERYAWPVVARGVEAAYEEALGA
ncbi:MAG: glycosyltransferase family 4 protein [Thermoplasmatota archaeon]